MIDPMHFEAHADIYGDARPPYPPALWDSLRGLGVLEPGLRALDIGAGTGQATGPLLAAGLSVTAVEPGPRLAARLRGAHPDATVIVERVEDVELPENAFDIAIAATSIHWIDLDIALPKVHRALTHDGRFLVWRNVFGDPDARTPFRERVARIVQDRGAPPRPGPDPEDVSALTAELTRSGLFTVDVVRTFRWNIELNDRQVFRLFSTFSDWTSEEAEQAAAAVRELGGTVIEHYRTWLVALTPAKTPCADLR
ncbi:class I SAM-dependent methyltransferase [Rhodococcus sp. NCIMB 12038]|uniref:class I SAM-dependent methyltransferase n=1 Tax=Rhodococcus sp. NCIMB 12038 TaxID=933800 RepID=UPI000B3D3F4E|nr:class I SAM-dependent methyltransferase [Rhodococcus sp. NCIMB 12038]OUS95795.1 SAM-dependent methyltransferase [Rhodococcus sp. NCIMB 12038]